MANNLGDQGVKTEGTNMRRVTHHGLLHNELVNASMNEVVNLRKSEMADRGVDV